MSLLSAVLTALISSPLGDGDGVSGWQTLLAGLRAGQVTLSTIGGIAMLGLLTGNLVTRREHRETRADRDTWRDNSLKKDETIAALTHQLEVASKGGDLGLALLEKIDAAVEQKMTKGNAP